VTKSTPHAARPLFERAVLLYSPLWMTAVAIVMRTRALAHWDDPTHLAFGLALGLPVLFLPWIVRDRQTALADRYASRAVVFLVLTTFVQMLVGSELFFRRLGMEYHFAATWSWNGSPVFLYPMTLAYFATYYVVIQIITRAILPPSGPFFWIGLATLSYAVAFAETMSMASPMLAELFFYRDRGFMLRYGSFCYGTVFFVTMPMFLRLDSPRSLGRVALGSLAANAVALALYGIYALVLPFLH